MASLQRWRHRGVVSGFFLHKQPHLKSRYWIFYSFFVSKKRTSLLLSTEDKARSNKNENLLCQRNLAQNKMRYVLNKPCSHTGPEQVSVALTETIWKKTNLCLSWGVLNIHMAPDFQCELIILRIYLLKKRKKKRSVNIVALNFNYLH